MGKKVLVLGSFADSLIRFRGSLISELVRRGHSVVACAPEMDGDTIAKLKALGARSESVPLRRASIDPVSDLRLIGALSALMRLERPDVLFAYTIKPVVYGAISARIVGGIHVTPMITGLGYAFTSGEGLSRRLMGTVARLMYRVSLAKASRVFFQNPDDLKLFRDYRLVPPTTPTTLVPGSGVDLFEYAQAPIRSELVFLMIARIVRDKGIVEYVEAARQVKARFPHARFQLAGWIDENPSAISRGQLEQWVAEGTIEFLGKLADVRPALRDCSVYVLPSYREGTPRTVLEAMAIGRAVITTDVPGCRETVTPNVNGFLVPAANVDALVTAMFNLATSPELVRQFALASRLMVESKFDVRVANQRLIDGMGLAT